MKRDGLVIHWIRHHRRTAELAARLGARAVFVYPRSRGGAVGVLLRYLGSAVETWRLLARSDAAFVVAAIPPAPLIAVIECFRLVHGRKLRVAYDAHTGAIVDGKWRWTLFLLRWALNRSDTALLVTVDALAEEVGPVGAPVFRLPDPWPRPPIVAGLEATEDDGRPTVFVINSYAPDEPLHEILEAARRLPGVRFEISGDPGRRAGGPPADLPDNVELTGFLPDPAYWVALRAADLAMVLTTRRLTMVCGAYEALAAGVPLVLSDHEHLRDYFGGPAVFARNDASGIVDAVEKGLRDREGLRLAIDPVIRRRELEWSGHLAAVSEFLGLSS